jgi:Kae1-associated kinase Bud32
MFRLSKAGIRCPRIVALGRYSIYMERLEGVLLKDKEISSREISDAGQILGRMHSLDIIHGDFTPANLILDNSGKVYVIDFGLSAMAKSEEEKAVDLLLMKRYLKKNLYSLFEDAYSKTYNDSGKILRRLEEVEKRGRYQIRTLA